MQSPQSFCGRMNTDSNYFYIFAAENKDKGSMKNRNRNMQWTFLTLVSVILFLVACGQRGRDRPIQNLDILGPICH